MPLATRRCGSASPPTRGRPGPATAHGSAALAAACVLALAGLVGACAIAAGLPPGTAGSPTAATVSASPGASVAVSSGRPSDSALPRPIRPPAAIRCTAVEGGTAQSFGLCVPVLEYHRIATESEARGSLPGLVVSPAEFEAQMVALRAAGWRTITLGELANDLAAKRSPPARTLVITIDDGWFDGYLHAFPILEGQGFVATFFAISSRIGSTSFLSAAEMRDLVAAGNEIGNHTDDHRNLLDLDSAAIRKDVETASERLAAATGVRPRSFSYPRGGVSARVVAAVAECRGIEVAVSERRTIGETWAGRFDVPRLDVGPGVSPGTLLAWLGG